MKSEDLIPQIIEAKDKSDAVEVMKNVLNILNFSNEYAEISKLANELEEDKDYFTALTDSIEDCKGDIHKLFDMKLKLNYFYRDTGDKYKFKAHQWKIFWQEVKTQRRAEAMANIKENPDILESMSIKSASASALREIIGADAGYQEFIKTYPLAEGFQKSVDNFLDVIYQFTNTVASMIAFEKNVEMKDQK